MEKACGLLKLTIGRHRAILPSSRGASFIMKTLLLVEDGAIETLLMKKALERAGAPCSLQAVANGNQAVVYLSGAGPYADRQAYPLPALVLLDLSMPGRNGHEVLKWIRTQDRKSVV